MIEIKNIYAGYGKRNVLENINFSIPNASFTAILGPNGAGKSTLLKVICSLIKPFAGIVSINGENISSFKRTAFAKRVAFMPQNTEIVFPFSVREFVLLARYPYMNMFKIPSMRDYEIVDEVLEFCGLAKFANRNINELSGGERQRAFIAQTISQQTDIIVLDEPTSHLDIGGQVEILELLRTLNSKYNKTIIATLHDLNSAGEFCGDIVLLNGGKVHSQGAPEKVLNYADIETVYKTTVVVKTNPMSGKPYVIPVGKQM